MTMSLLDGPQVLKSVYDDVNALRVKSFNSLVTVSFDAQALAYNGSGLLSTVTYYSGGLAGTAVATLTLLYDGSNRLVSVVKT